ncbi:hypothetical protein NDU88_002618 [Pleurodeles waltl]|uniref:Uncharacterized protein n=1 Tax=Pleurodeles waltl TaxID=8319 RepID=A0AAV7UC19_PLEWA|nr:hypothetical protein NDU88_002618 [Pleurodeles waltl]
MVWGSSPPRDLRILSAEGCGCSVFTALSRPPFWVAVAAKLSGEVFRAISAPRWGAAVPTCAVYSPIASLQFLRPPVVIMAGFKLRAWVMARGRRTMLHSLMFCFVLLLTPLVAKVSMPLVPFNGWCGVLTSTGPSYPLSRRLQLQRVHCSVAATILGRGSREVVGGSFPGKLCPKVNRCGLYSCFIFSDHFPSIFKTSGRYYGRI